MKQKPWWLLIILISSIQLIFLLVIVGALFSWLGVSAQEQLAIQDCIDNQRIGKSLVDRISKLEIRQVRNPQHPDCQKLDEIIHSAGLGDNKFVWLLDRSNRKVLCQHGPEKLQATGNVANYEMKFVGNRWSESTKLIESVSNQKEQRMANGCISLAGLECFVNAQFVPQLNAVLVVGKPKSLAFHGVSALLSRANAGVILMVALLGLMGTFATVYTLRKVSRRLENVNVGLERKISKNALELVRMQNAIIFGLAKLAESRDNDTGQHLDRIRSYVTILAEDIACIYPEINEETIHNLALASSLHDIGKVGIPDSILLKQGQLSPEERGIMELHTLIGGECLDAIQSRLGDSPFLEMARQVAFYHHERWDGTGYPHSLHGEEIPLPARIVAVADVYDALTSKRPYKKALTHAESKEIIVAGSGKHFDPVLVESFLRHEDKFEAVSRHQLVISDEDSLSKIQRLFELLESGEAAATAS